MSKVDSYYFAASNAAPTPIQPDDPSVVGNGIVWLKADAGITLIGSGISNWQSQFAIPYNFAQGTSTRRPQYTAGVYSGGTLPQIRFRGTDHLRNSSTTDFKFLHDGTDHSVYVVIKIDTPSNPLNAAGIYSTARGTVETGASLIFRDTTSSVFHSIKRGVGGSTVIGEAGNGFALVKGNLLIISLAYKFNNDTITDSAFLYEGTTLKNSAPNLNLPPSTGNSTHGLHLGWVPTNLAQFGLIGDLQEIIFYDAFHDANVQTALGLGLGAKWML